MPATPITITSSQGLARVCREAAAKAARVGREAVAMAATPLLCSGPEHSQVGFRASHKAYVDFVWLEVEP